VQFHVSESAAVFPDDDRSREPAFSAVGQSRAAAAAKGREQVRVAIDDGRRRRRGRQGDQTEATPDSLHAGTTERVGESVQQDSLPRHLHARRTGAENRPHRVTSPGKLPPIIISPVPELQILLTPACGAYALWQDTVLNSILNIQKAQNLCATFSKK